MVNNGNKTNCGFSDEIVSYIYDEIGAVERAKFETHLSDCMVCTDEFAAISNARFSVFEWQSEEFAHLPTPEIIIPYDSKHVTENDSVGLLAGIRGWLSLVNSPVAVAAVLALTLVLGLLAVTYLGGGQQIVANVDVPPSSTQNDKATIGQAEIPIPVASETTAPKNSTPGRETRTVRAVDNRRTRPYRQMTADSIPDPALKLRRAPVLSIDDDNDDRSLRLTDLFDEVGG